MCMQLRREVAQSRRARGEPAVRHTLLEQRDACRERRDLLGLG
jgi:hypothetical protein